MARSLWVRGLVFALVLYQGINTVSHSPYLLGWFNDISGGPSNGWRYLADSNTDWGQGYAALSQFQRTQGIPEIQLAGFVFYDPAIYALDYSPLTPLGGDTPAIFPSRFAPVPGHYAISLTAIDGIPLADNEMYDWFRWRKPTARIANAIHYYYVTEAETQSQWVAQCTKPTVPLEIDDIRQGFGDLASRRYIPFDCTQSWIIPDSAWGSGAYVLHNTHIADNLMTRLHYTQPKANNRFIQQHLMHTDISYQQRQYRLNPAFSIFRSQPMPEMFTYNDSLFLWLDSAETPLNQPANLILLTAPIHFNGPLTFIGIDVYKSDDEIEVETWWRVSQSMDESQPLSVMAHLLDKSGANIGVADGLGITPDVWSAGDVIIQRHRFAAPTGSRGDTLVFRTGLYWIESGQRMTISTDPRADAIYIPVSK